MKRARVHIAARVIGCSFVRSSRSNEEGTCAHRCARDRVQRRAVIERSNEKGTYAHRSARDQVDDGARTRLFGERENGRSVIE
jgi:hypothetical protein